MKKSEEFLQTVIRTEDEVCGLIEENLRRIGRELTEDDEPAIEFFSYSTAIDLSIESILPDGSYVSSEVNDTIRNGVKNGFIPLLDAISILRDIEEME